MIKKSVLILTALALIAGITGIVLANGIVTKISTISGTNIISDFPNFYAVFNNRMYFRTSDGEDAPAGVGAELYMYDGSNPPSLALDIYPGPASGTPNSGNPQQMAAFNGELYFSAVTGNGLGREMYAWDGSDLSGLRLVADLRPGAANSDFQFPVVYAGELYFSAWYESGGTVYRNELVKYDGTGAPVLVDDISRAGIPTDTEGSLPKFLTVFDGKLYFQAEGDAASGRELWVYDASQPTVHHVNPGLAADIRPGAGDSDPKHLVVWNGKLYFTANDGSGTKLFSYDGTNPPNLVNTVNTVLPTVYGMEVYNNKLFMIADGGDGSGRELWDWDGTNPPTLSVDIWPGSSSGTFDESDSNVMQVFNGNLYISALSKLEPIEVWRFDEDNNAPVVTASTPANGATVSAGLTSITVRYNEDMRADGSADAADTIANYLLVEANGDGFQTTACDTGVDAGDTNIPILSAVYSNNGGSGPFTALLGVDPLQNGSYRLFVCGTTSVYDLARNVLNGGTDSRISFTVADAAQVEELPKTGFAPGRMTALPAQTVDKAYLKTGDVYLSIPSLGVETDIVGVPITEDGWDLSWLGDNVGWLQGTAFPSWAGNSSLTAHIVDAFGQPGVFKDLGSLKYGDRVVVSVYGQEYVYEVRTVEGFVRPDDTSSIFQHEEYPWLTLVTCRGYNEKTDDYSWRVVVRAVQVDVR